MTDERPTQNVLLNDVRVDVLETIGREAMRTGRSRVSQIRHILNLEAERILATEKANVGNDGMVWSA